MFNVAGKQEHKAQAVFNHTEDYVLFPDEATTSLCAWNSRNASRKQLLSLGKFFTTTLKHSKNRGKKEEKLLPNK